LRATRIKLLLASLGATVLVVTGAGCNTGSEADLDNGRALFIERCGTCHALAEAATTAEIAPDLDAAFADARASGMDSDTVDGVVRDQIAFPREADPEETAVYMPADLVVGEDAKDVAAYVASVAGVPGIEPPEAPGGPGGQVFANNGCGACHALAAAQSTGTVGPDLDEVIPGQDAKMLEESIVDPEARPTPGFPAGVMPANYEEQISEEDLELLIEFLLENAGNGGGGNGGGGGGGGGS
jgi:mono/diheme cytochrome c family protein